MAEMGVTDIPLVVAGREEHSSLPAEVLLLITGSYKPLEAAEGGVSSQEELEAVEEVAVGLSFLHRVSRRGATASFKLVEVLLKMSVGQGGTD